MPADWIKMRASLVNHPRVIAMAKYVSEDASFQDWGVELLQESIPHDLPKDFVRFRYAPSRDASRLIVTAGLLCLWSVAREHGVFHGDDLVLKHLSYCDLDAMSGVPALGEAMMHVGWAVEKNGITLPKFKNYNIPNTQAERSKRYRQRKKEKLKFTAPIPQKRKPSRAVTKRHVETEAETESIKKPPTPLPKVLDTSEFREAWTKWMQYRREIHKPLTATGTKSLLTRLAKKGPEESIKLIDKSVDNGWQGLIFDETSSKPRTGHAEAPKGKYPKEKDNADLIRRLDADDAAKAKGDRP